MAATRLSDADQAECRLRVFKRSQPKSPTRLLSCQKQTNNKHRGTSAGAHRRRSSQNVQPTIISFLPLIRAA
jgi:hypothetical protein